MFFFFKQKTAYEMRISDWSSDVCSSDLQYSQIAPHCGLINHKAGRGYTVQIKMRKGSGIARFCFHCLSFSTSCAGARRPCASSPRMEINPELKIERLGQFLYLPRQALLVQHVHEGIGIKLLHIEHALAFPCAGDRKSTRLNSSHS